MSDAIRIPAVTVTFEPDSTWPERLRAILAICSRCIVVDNSRTAEARAFVAATITATPGASLIANPDNPGIGRAFNQGFSALQSSGDLWALAFDQDSTPSPDLAGKLLMTARSPSTDRRSVAAVGSNWHDAISPERSARHLIAPSPAGLTFRRCVAARDLDNVVCVITSGSLFSLEAWSQIGGFDEDLFLDLVDTDFCLRARRAGWRVAVSAGAALAHNRGSKRPVRLLGKVFHPSFTPPFRLECLSRNRIRLIQRHGTREPAWVAYELCYAAKLCFDILLLEDGKTAKLKACLHGTITAFGEPESVNNLPPQIV